MKTTYKLSSLFLLIGMFLSTNAFSNVNDDKAQESEFAQIKRELMELKLSLSNRQLAFIQDEKASFYIQCVKAAVAPFQENLSGDDYHVIFRNCEKTANIIYDKKEKSK